MDKEPNIDLALKVHGELSRLIRPVTPESIRASSVKQNRTLQAIIIGGIVSFFIFVLPLAITGLPDFVQILGAAGLGITFHSLYTANQYLHNSTFDPRYSQRYVINYALGLFAGTILGLFGKDMLAGQNAKFMLTTNLLALVGGFSAEAVAQILQRIAETLVTLVRGSSKDKAAFETEKAITDANSKLASKLTNALEGDGKQIKENVEKLLKDLLETKRG